MKNKDSDFQKKHRTRRRQFLWCRFLDKFSGVKAREAINAIFSDYEKRLITKRLAALALIKEGIGAREIGRLLWLSRSTIAALKKIILHPDGDYKSQRSFKRKKHIPRGRIELKKSSSWLDDFFQGVDLWELIKNPPRPPGIGLKQ
jgi:hypothetical protein